jgi:LPS sulfotransferase NodH
MGTRFVIFAMARSGSGHLCDQLRAQPDIWCHNEVFHPGKVHLRTPFEDDRRGKKLAPNIRALRESNREAFLEKVFELSFGRPHVGFKIFPKQGDDEAFRLLADPSLAKIVLLRANVLAMYSSLLAARDAGAWNSKKMMDAKRSLVPFEEKKFRSLHEKHAQFYARVFELLNSSGQNPHVIRYEELNLRSHIAMLLRYLGAASAVVPLESRDVRGPADIVSRFSNPDTVRAFLSDRGLMHWAYEADMSFEPLS